MVNELIDAFLEHPKRRLIVAGIGGALALFFVLPAWDHYSGAKESVAEYETELHEISYSLANLDLLKTKLADYEQPNAVNETLGAEAAEEIRETVTRLTHEMGCNVRRLTMSDPMVRSWHEGDDAFGVDVVDDGRETAFELQTRSLRLSAGGSLGQLTRLVAALTRLDRFAVPANMTLQRQGIDGHLILDVEISLFNLVETFD